MINFYRGNELTADGLACANFEREYTVRDDRAALEFFDELWRSAGDNYTAVAEQVLSQTDFWGDDLTKYHELVGQIASYLESMNTVGVVKTIEAALENQAGAWTMFRHIKINPSDNVAVVSPSSVPALELVIDDVKIILKADIPQAHKFAITDIEAGADIIKYGSSISHATEAISPGEHVHTHNCKPILTAL